MDLDTKMNLQFYLYQDHTTMFKNGMKHGALLLAPANEKFGGGWAELGIAEFGKGNNDQALEYFEKQNKIQVEKFVSEKIDEI